MGIPANVKPGDFFLVSFDGKNPNLSDPKKWAMNGGLIRIAQWANGNGFGQYEHAAMFIGNDTIVEAQSGGVALANVHRYDGNDTFWSTGIIVNSVFTQNALCAAAKGYVGVPYSWLDYAAIAAHHLHLLPATDALKNYVATSKHMICSQVVDQCYQDAKVPLFTDNRWAGFVTPGDLYQLLLAKKA